MTGSAATRSPPIDIGGFDGPSRAVADARTVGGYFTGTSGGITIPGVAPGAGVGGA